MMILETPDMVAVPERVHDRAGQSRGMHLRRGCSRLCCDDCHTVGGGMVRSLRVLSTAAGHCAAVVARLELRGDELGLDLIGLVSRQTECWLYVSSSTDRYDGKK